MIYLNIGNRSFKIRPFWHTNVPNYANSTTGNSKYEKNNNDDDNR